MTIKVDSFVNLAVRQLWQNLKITPDIVCCLAAIEMQQLGISTKKDMVKLRSECANYGIRKPQMSQQTMPILQQKHDKIVGIIE
jgi:hypothetical protein